MLLASADLFSIKLYLAVQSVDAHLLALRKVPFALGSIIRAYLHTPLLLYIPALVAPKAGHVLTHKQRRAIV